MSFASLPSVLAAETDRTAAAAPPEAEQVTVELAVSPDGWVAPGPRRASDTTPYADIEMPLQRVDPLEPLRKLLPEGGRCPPTTARVRGRHSARTEDLRPVHQPRMDA